MRPTRPRRSSDASQAARTPTRAVGSISPPARRCRRFSPWSDPHLGAVAAHALLYSRDREADPGVTLMREGIEGIGPSALDPDPARVLRGPPRDRTTTK